MKRGVLLALIGMVFLLNPAIASAVEYGGLGGQPANPDKNNPRTKSIFIFELAGGKTKNDAVRVVNNSSEAKTVEIYATDSELASGGSFACTQKSDTQKKVGTWIEFEQTQVTLAPASDKVVNFTISVPRGTDVGEHNGCIVIQELNQKTKELGSGVQLSFRSALRTVVTVPGKIIKEAEFTDLKVKPEAKKYVLTAELINKGNVSLDTDIKVDVHNLFGQKTYTNGGVYPLLAQKQPTVLNFEFNKPFWGGIYRATGVAAYNGDTKVGLGAEGSKDVVKRSPASWFIAVPHPLAIIIYLATTILAAIALKKYLDRSRQSRTLKSAWVDYTVKKSDTIFKLSKTKNTNWKTIAKINKLKPPYELEPGSIIKLPKSSKK